MNRSLFLASSFIHWERISIVSIKGKLDIYRSIFSLGSASQIFLHPELFPLNVRISW